MDENNKMSVKSEAEIPEWKKKDYIEGVEILHENFLDLVIEHVSENSVEGKKRDLTENEDKLDYYVSRCKENNIRYFKSCAEDIHTVQYKIISDYTELKRTEQYRATEELNDNMTRYKSKITKYTNKVNRSVETLVSDVNQKRQYTEALLFYQELSDLFDEIRFGHVTDYDSDYLKIAGYGHYRNRKIEGMYKTDRKSEIARIHEIINNPKPAQSSEQIRKENHEFYETAKREINQFIFDNITQIRIDQEQSWYARIFTCNVCKKEFKSGDSRLSMGKQVKNLQKHLHKEHALRTTHDWKLYSTLEDAL